MTLEQENLLKEQVKKRERLAREIYTGLISHFGIHERMRATASESFEAADTFLKVAEEERK